MTRPKNPDPLAQLRKAERQAKKDKRELQFLTLWRTLHPDMPEPVRDYKFHPTRKWRFDWAWEQVKLAIEIDGGSFTFGGHNRGAQIQKDQDKANVALSMGWRVMRFSTKHFDKPHIIIDHVVRVMCGVVIELEG